MKKGISLIVLVITIIVMIILAATVVVSLTSSGIIDRANQAVKLTDEKQVQDLAALIWAETYLDPEKKEDIENVVKTELAKQGVTETDWNIQVSNTGIVITSKNAPSSSEEQKNTVTISIVQDDEKSGAIDEQYAITINGETYTELGTYEVPIGADVECTISTRILGYEHTITYNGTAVAGKNETYTFKVNNNVEISLWYSMGDSGIDILQNQ